MSTVKRGTVTLTEEQRNVLLRQLEGYNLDETAEQLGISREKVRFQRNRCRELIAAMRFDQEDA
jgi:DNA-binding CsgD family transcriptional regulator